jgi:hypothetical protein
MYYRYSLESCEEKIINGTESEEERIAELMKFDKYLKTYPFGTLRNYPRRMFIIAIMRHHPSEISELHLEEIHIDRINKVMEEIYKAIAENRKIKFGFPYLQAVLKWMDADQVKWLEQISSIVEKNDSHPIVIQFAAGAGNQAVNPVPKQITLDNEEK